MPVNSTHPQYDEYIKKWKLVRDVIKSDVKNYIKDVEKSQSHVLNSRNARYKDDARFTNFTARTKNGLVGSVFRKEPEIDLPESVDYLRMDATGSKMSLEKLSQECIGEVLQAGRFGLLVDYPRSDEDLTKEQVERLNLKARIAKYKAENIINWQNTIINGEYVLSLVVLKECNETIAEDGFTWIKEDQYRVLRLLDGTYVQQLYNDQDELIAEYYPRDFNGNYFNFIPFVFIGAEDNDSIVDPSPLYDLAELNIGHLRNSADYEESVHICGQPTLILSTKWSPEQFKDANPNGIQIGARTGHNLGEGGNAQLLQANPNQLADEAMKRKEEQAVMIGARLISAASSNETAEAARIKHSSENSVLSVIVSNVNDAIYQCIEICLMFHTKEVNIDDVVFEINKEFYDPKLDPQLLMAYMQMYNNSIISVNDVRDYVRKNGGLPEDRTNDDIESEVDNINPIGQGFNNNFDNNLP